MNINPLLESALFGLTRNGHFVPHGPRPHAGDDDVYVTYYTYLDQPESFSDDSPEYGVTYGTVDIFCRGNFKSLLADVKARLRGAGFSVTIGPELYESDTKYNHVSIDINIEDLEA